MRALPWPVWLGIGVSLIAAAVGSWAGLQFLASATGWLWWSSHLLPASVDIGGVSAGWVWLRGVVTPHARQYARRLTFFAATLSLGGNAVSHLVAEGVLDGGAWPLIVAVGAIPAVMLVALVHLAALVTEIPHRPESTAVEPTAPAPQVRALASTPTPSAAPAVKPSPAARANRQGGTRQAIVLDILTRASAPDEVPQPAQIRSDWNVSQATAERVRAEVLAALNTTPTTQEA